jgi:hypothetical protein
MEIWQKKMWNVDQCDPKWPKSSKKCVTKYWVLIITNCLD